MTSISSWCLPRGGPGRRPLVIGSLLFAFFCLGPAPSALARADTWEKPVEGVASWYGGHHAGKPTASGEIHRTDLRTAAHRHLPFGTMVKVTNLRNGKVSIVRVNDRGPFVAGRSIDLSEEAARDLAMLDDGLAPVRLEILVGR